ncbi:hypothetical protein BIU96_05110 [Curtobacterium sp. MCBA15_008]|nr:hypothetical protein BIU96_05110 [Curtobacterium sp. MCBA15_008]
MLAPAYIGGWPSSNFGLVNGDLLLSSLLYNEQVLIHDPIADWFSDDQYFVEHMMASRPGHRDLERNRQNTAETRQFLFTAAQTLRGLRPLIESGIIGLIPTSHVIRNRNREIADLVARLAQLESLQHPQYTSRFAPHEIPVEDNRRGMFVFAGDPDPGQQLAQALSRGLTYFAREYVLAEEYGATYTAAFDHELYICRNGTFATRPQRQVTEAILQSRLPIFHALNPRLITDIHQDDAFASFRSELHGLYENAPAGATQADLAAYVADQEQVRLQPTLDAAKRSAERGLLDKIGVGLSRGAFGIVSGIVTDLASGTNGIGTLAGAVGAAATGFVGRPSRGSSQPVWSSLVRHHKSVSDEFRGVQVAQGGSSEGWNIPTTPSTTVTVTSGALISDFLPKSGTAQLSPNGYQDGVYAPCWCGSGRKYKFCCERADRNWRPIQ